MNRLVAQPHKGFAVFSFFLDFGLLVAAGHLSALALASFYGYSIFPLEESYEITVLLLAAGFTLVANTVGVYQPWKGQGIFRESRLVLVTLVSLFICFVAYVFITKSGASFSRAWIISWFLLTGIFLIGVRFFLRTLLRRYRKAGLDSRTIVLVGDGELAQKTLEHLSMSPWLGYSVIGYFSGSKKHKELIGAPCLGSLAEIENYFEDNAIDQVWIVLPWTDTFHIQKVLHGVEMRAVDVRIVPDIFRYQLLNHSIDSVAGLPIINISINPQAGLDGAVKRAMDAVCSAVGLVFLMPLFFVVAILIRLESQGPIFFRQLRHGWDGRSFEIIKFRTMFVEKNSEERAVFTQAVKADPRVTRIGRVLRRSSIDELPQLMNVLKGEMSLVGPRPHAVEMNQGYQGKVEQYLARHKVLPGITGWAQVNGWRGETDTLDKIEERIKHDLFYIQNWSLWLDIKILILTVWRGGGDKNAY